jgi:hypothetical protein
VSGFLNRLLVSQGYTLPIVPELDMLTIGKFLNGFSVKILCIKFFGNIDRRFAKILAFHKDATKRI